MQPTIRPTDATLGATITGVDLASMTQDVWQTIIDAFHEHAVLVFPDQHLSDDAQVEFAKRFGDIEHLAPDTKSVEITNRKASGSLFEEHEYRARMMRGNEGWHTDSSYMPLAAKASVLSARVVPPQGGETQWADMRAGYDALDAALQERIEGLCAYHSIYHSQALIGHKVEVGAGYGFHEEEPPLRPLVKVHPVTGRKALFIGRHAYGIPGLEADESASLLGELTAFACAAPRTYMHRWSPGDVVIWDNRCVLHRARPYDYTVPRVMRHTRIAGDPDTELALNTALRSNESVLAAQH